MRRREGKKKEQIILGLGLLVPCGTVRGQLPIQKEGNGGLLEFHNSETQTIVEFHMDKGGSEMPALIFLLLVY